MPFKRTNIKKPIFKSMNKKNMVAKKRRSNLVSLIKQVNLKQSETKYLTRSVTFNNKAANYLFAVRLWGDPTIVENVMPEQGLTDANRIGDSVQLTGFKCRFSAQISGLYNQSDISLYYVPYNSDQGDPTDRTQLFHWISGFTSLDPIQTKRWPGIKFLGKHKVKAADASVTGDRMLLGSFWIPINKKVNFKSDVTVQPTNLKENGLILWTFNAYNNSPDGAVMVTDMRFNTTCYFKDP